MERSKERLSPAWRDSSISTWRVTCDRVRYEQEKRACYDQLAGLHPNGYSIIMNAGETLEQLETLWSTATALEKRNCCDLQSQQSSFG